MSTDINQSIYELAAYAIERDLIDPADRTWFINRILMHMGLDSYAEPDSPSAAPRRPLAEILRDLTDDAAARGILPNNGITARDLFDTRLMGECTPRPSAVQAAFARALAISPEEATHCSYQLALDTNYIRTDRIRRDRRWKVSSPYGEIDITINLSKPEKDPLAIAAAGRTASSAYPKCQLCMENEGYAGRMDHPARENLRIIPLTLAGEAYGFQYSPYVYYNEHCIVLNRRHIPMQINRRTFARLLDFVKQFPHYFLGSNADLPIVGGSILSHDHFQGGHYTFAMEKAKMEETFTIPGFSDVTCGIVRWPLSVIRIRHEDPGRLVELADHILTSWRKYSDPDAMILAQSDGVPHNTITPIARKRGEEFELDLALRNNLTTDEYPLGLYHPHAQWHHIKKENIGLIEVMGLAVLPSRLKQEMEDLGKCLLAGGDPSQDPSLAPHAAWAARVSAAHPEMDAGNVDAILQEEIGQVFVHVLEDAGVYKCTPEGRAAFRKFIDSL